MFQLDNFLQASAGVSDKCSQVTLILLGIIGCVLAAAVIPVAVRFLSGVARQKRTANDMPSLFQAPSAK